MFSIGRRGKMLSRVTHVANVRSYFALTRFQQSKWEIAHEPSEITAGEIIVVLLDSIVIMWLYVRW